MEKNNKPTNRTSIPSSWLGKWVDTNGKQLFIEKIADNKYNISVFDKEGKPYRQFFSEISTNLPGSFINSSQGLPILQVEAGAIGLGPTYKLCFKTLSDNNELELADNQDDIGKIRIEPAVGMGLYDDWEEDFGVPWAFPLTYFAKNKEE